MIDEKTMGDIITRNGMVRGEVRLEPEEYEKIDEQCLAVDPAVYGNVSAMLLIQKVTHRLKPVFGPVEDTTFYKIVGSKELKGDIVQQADQIYETWANVGRPIIAVDSGGLGIGYAPILRRMRVDVRAITLHGGVTSSYNSVSKTEMMSYMQMLFEQQKVLIGNIPHKIQLVNSLERFRATFLDDGRLVYSIKTLRSEHGDWGMAAALGLWALKKGQMVAVDLSRLHER